MKMASILLLLAVSQVVAVRSTSFSLSIIYPAIYLVVHSPNQITAKSYRITSLVVTLLKCLNSSVQTDTTPPPYSCTADCNTP